MCSGKPCRYERSQGTTAGHLPGHGRPSSGTGMSRRDPLSSRTRCCRYGVSGTSRSSAKPPVLCQKTSGNPAPDIPWSKIIGMRNIPVHGYFLRLTRTSSGPRCKSDLPAPRPAVKALSNKLEEMGYGG